MLTVHLFQLICEVVPVQKIKRQVIIMAFKSQRKGFATKAIHVGQDPDQWSSLCVIPPIITSTTFKQDGPALHRGFEYSRSGNPTREVLEQCLASLDNGKYGLTFSSGLGAATAILTMLSNGDHIVINDVYAGTNCLVRKVASRMGLEASFVDATDLATISAAFKSNTKLLWIETPTNPLIKVIDIEALSKLAHQQNDIIVVVDNTFLTSYFQRPLELGADIVMYSLTKYMNGHSDVLMGATTLRDDKLYQRLKFLQNATGIVPSPFDCYQVNRSLKTLSIRMEQHQRNGIAIAKFLESHPFVEKVMHPALPSHPQHEIALRQSYGYSGTFSFLIKGGLQQSSTLLKSLKVFTLAISLGGYESLAELPSLMSMKQSSLTHEERVELGITDSLIRISVGLEDVDDLIEDLQQALTAAAAN